MKRTKINQKEAGFGPFLKKHRRDDFFLLNIFIDHHTVKSHLLMHVYNTDTIYELKSGRKRLDIFTFTVPISCT